MHESLCAAPGLRNLGNTCFLNTILQSLASLSLFIDYLKQVNGTNSLFMCNNEEDSFRSQCLTPLANSLLECLVGLSPAPINSINNQAAKVISSVTTFSNSVGTRDPRWGSAVLSCSFNLLSACTTSFSIADVVGSCRLNCWIGPQEQSLLFAFLLLD